MSGPSYEGDEGEALGAFLKRGGLDVASLQPPLRIGSLGSRYERAFGLFAASSFVISSAPLLSVPFALLITPAKVRSSTAYLSCFDPSAALDDVVVLSFFLVCQCRSLHNGPVTSLSPYLRLLPSRYSTLEWWSPSQIRQHLGAQHVRAQQQRCQQIREEWIQLNRALLQHVPHMKACGRIRHADIEHERERREDDRCLPLCYDSGSEKWNVDMEFDHSSCIDTFQPTDATTKSKGVKLTCLLTLAEYQWARSTVMTRSCFWSTDFTNIGEKKYNDVSSCVKLKHRAQSNSKLIDTSHSLCLIPFLDLFNHSHSVSSSVRYDSKNQRYELFIQPSKLQTLSYAAHQQVYISYGKLGNTATLSQYGFVDTDNAHHLLPITIHHFERFISGPSDNRLMKKFNLAWTDNKIAASQDIVHCLCGKCIISPSSLALSPIEMYQRYVQPVSSPLSPPTNFQLVLLKNCGLYHCLSAYQVELACQITQQKDIAESEFDAVERSEPSLEMRSCYSELNEHAQLDICCCSLPWDLVTYARVRCLDSRNLRTDDRESVTIEVYSNDGTLSRRRVIVERSRECFRDEDLPVCTAKLLSDQAMSVEHDNISRQWLLAYLTCRLITVSNPSSLSLSTYQLLQLYSGTDEGRYIEKLGRRYEISNRRLIWSCMQALLTGEEI